MVTVTLRGVTKEFGEVKALNNIDLEIEDEELFFLLGPSGCGKTTTLRVIAGFNKPEYGQVLFDDKAINDVPAYKRNIGMVFQNYALWPHMTCYENIIYGLKIRNVPKADIKKRAEEVLEVVQMGGYGSRYPNQLSGGQQQRIALARAIVTEPEVLLLDEPLSNLDAKLRFDTRKEIKRIQSDLGITSIYVTHDQDEALSMADKIAVMNNGIIEQIGGPREIYAKPVNSFVAGFIGETNFVYGVIDEVEGRVATVRTPSGTLFDGLLIDDGIEIGSDVVCSIRPEIISLVDSDDRDVVRSFCSTVIAHTYYGVVEHFYVEFGDVELKISNFNPEYKEHRQGDTVYFSFQPDDVDVFLFEVK